jgi:WD40 repeat protein
MEELIVLDGHDGIMKWYARLRHGYFGRLRPPTVHRLRENNHARIVCSVAWSPAGTSDQVVSVDESSLRLWDVNIAASTARVCSMSVRRTTIADETSDLITADWLRDFVSAGRIGYKRKKE